MWRVEAAPSPPFLSPLVRVAETVRQRRLVQQKSSSYVSLNGVEAVWFFTFHFVGKKKKKKEDQSKQLTHAYERLLL